MGQLRDLRSANLLRGAQGDVEGQRERARLGRVRRLTLALWLLVGWMAVRSLWGEPLLPSLSLSPQWASTLAIVSLLGAVLILPMVAAGRSPHVLYRPSELSIGLDDVVGCEVVREEVIRTLNLFLAHSTLREQLGANARRAVLFEGPPGTGKTYMAKAMARDAGVPFLFVSSSAFQSMYYGQTNRKIRSYFRALRNAARREGGAIGFIEEIDAIGAARTGMGASTSREGISGVVNELLIQLQSFDEPTPGARVRGWFFDRFNSIAPEGLHVRKPPVTAANVLVVGATNRAADLDPALLRPGRFDRQIVVDRPDRKGRQQILEVHTKGKPIDKEIDLDVLAASTPGFTGADLSNVINEAALLAARRGEKTIGQNELEEGIMRVIAGPEKKSRLISEQERKIIAYHEMGHALVGFYLEHTDEVHKITIVSRGQALGLTVSLPSQDRYLTTRRAIMDEMAMTLGGRAAEEIVFNEITTGDANDLERVTASAKRMIMRWGMSEKLGPRVLGRNHDMPFLGRDMGAEPDYSEEIAREIDDEIRRVIEEAHEMASKVLREHVGDLHKLAAILIERETIDKDQFERLLAGESEESVFPPEAIVEPEPDPAPAPEKKPVPRTSPRTIPGAAMQPPPPDPAAS